ncbi:hypothetical protein [Priestia filamentosa]|uniref:hypothetical protein n=1 Tax=Priestia filamentosa TaxID=1402861 RepID=UPI00397B84F7
MFKKTFVLSAIATLSITALLPFSEAQIVNAQEQTNTQQEQLSNSELDQRIVDKEIKEFYDSGYTNFEYIKGESPDSSSSEGTFSVQASGYEHLITSSKTLTRGDFYAQGTLMFIKTSVLGWGSALRSVIAGLLGVALGSVPDALVGEKVYMKKERKWIDRKKYIYDVRTTEYLKRGGKTVTLGKRVVRENGWGN